MFCTGNKRGSSSFNETVAIDNQFVNLEDTAGAVIEFFEGLSYFSVSVDYLK